MLRRSARTSNSSKIQIDDDATDPMELDESSSSSSSEEEEEVTRRPRRTARSKSPPNTTTATTATTTKSSSSTTRRSRRSTQFRNSMKEPPGDSVKDLFAGSSTKPHLDSDQFSQSSSSSTTTSGSSSDDEPLSSSLAKRKRKQQQDAKSPARRHSRARKSIPHDDSSSVQEDESSFEEEEQEMKMQRILASRTETKRKWREIGQSMNTSEVTDGSHWFQEQEKDDDDDDDNDDDDDDGVIEERFLVKWSQLSYMHVSWETQKDLIDQIEGAKNYLSTFFRKSQNGLLFSSDERKDGDYFDPGCVQIDRILEMETDTGNKKLPTTWEEEQACNQNDLGIVVDKQDPGFEDGTGRQILIKWESANYSDCTYEFERDLILADMEYRLPLKEYYERTLKPTKKELQTTKSLADTAMRRSYKLFGDATDMPEEKQQEQVTAYQNELANHVFLNGGQLRDYQAEGVAWFLANYVNATSCIMADEMGLGKTLQTAAFVNLLVQKMHRRGPFLIVVPLSTMAHWQREFVGWTGLNTIVYHGSAEDRSQIREVEFAYPQDRPDFVGSNALYLNKCAGHVKASKTGIGGPWMATVVVTTPEMLVADDWAELAAVRWEVLVVDEAHRLKNHNSKLAVNLRKEQFHFNHRILLTGTPIQNDVKEFWTLLNFIDPEKFDDQDDFLEKFGDIKSKDRIDELHDTIRPYILRRLKEDVEKSVPPKEETLVEVELTILQKQYYRALYEKNVKFLHKNKKKALDGPSLNNLAMQLRKCCNHLFLLNGVEEEIRQQQPKGSIMAEVDFLSKGSGKFVLLDKLLPRLKESGHRILLFSQFKIMLDILEDYLNARSMKFERIDGSITGPKRQQAIDRFQDPASKDPPFVMLLSTRAGGVGINLTSADTCIIFDSDWNPQNDLQAQARCHRIGQTKSVKVYRLLSRKTYEMQMFHMSSLKMGLDQAVLKGFENGASGEGAMTKEEVERLLRHGAYDIFNEDKAGTAEAESNDFVEQDIDSILARRSRTVIHDNTGSQSDAAGGTFSKASFSAKTPTGKKGSVTEDIDIEDPEFWTKMVGEAKEEERSELKPRKRSTLNYSEKFHDHRFNEEILDVSDSDASGGSDESDESDDEDFGDVVERSRWGGQRPENWKRSQARDLLDCIEQRGYGGLPWDQFLQKLPDSCKGFSEEAVRRMSWSLVLLGLAEVSRDEASMAMKRAARSAEKKREKEEGGVLAETSPSPMSSEAKAEILDAHFKKMWTVNRRWAQQALVDAGAYATSNEPRSIKVLEEKDGKVDECTKLFYKSVWPSLKGRGWKEESNETGNTFSYDEYKFGSPSAVLNEVVRIHPELANMVIPILNTLEQSRLNESRREVEDRTKHTTLDAQAIDVETLNDFLRRYSPLQLLSDRKTNNRLTIGRRVITSCHFSSVASYIVKRAESADAPQKSGDFLEDIISVDSRAALPHPLWTLKHDAILIRAIAKHGWVDREKSCRAIIEDPEIKWGFPFELTEEIVAKPLDASELGHLQSTASRAASFLENHSELVEALKGCNRPLIIESYGLKHHTPDAENADELQWKVADDLLRQASANNHGDSNVREPLDLPVKKDMAKRAKIVMRNTITSIKSGVQPGTAKSTVANPNVNQPTNDYGYAVIDQGDRCCILLAEMVRGIVKGSSTKMAKQMRFMFAIAHEEASALEKMFSSEESAKPKAEEMKKIAGYIATAKKSMKSAAIPSKNILRVMLGLEPLSLRSGNSTSASLFPTADTFENAASKPQSKKESHRREDGALGEKAIARSMKKAFDKSALEKSDGSPCLFFKYTDPDLGLQLTMIEIMILFTCCSEGIPLSSSHMSISSDSMESKLPWESIASILEITVKDALLTSTEKIVKCRAALTKLEANGDHDAKVHAARRVAMAETEEAMKEEAAQLAVDYAANPIKLAKKSVMLLEKLRKHGFFNYSFPSKFANKVENGLGTKVTSSFGKELSRLASEFDVADSLGGAMSFTTADMFDQNTADTSAATVAAYMDKKACRQVVSQIALLGKVRLMCAKNSEDDFRAKVAKAVSSSRKHEDTWDKRPSWWDDSSDHNCLLLKKLNEHGFSNFSANTDGFGSVDQDKSTSKSLRELGLTKSIIQQRANQLVRELHQAEEQQETMKLLQERRNRVASKTQGLDTLAECNKNKSKKTGATKTVQTGLRAFFASTKTASKKENVVDLSDNENAGSDSSTSAGKRKSGASSEDSPMEKKAKSDNEPVRVIPGKFDTYDADPLSPSRSAVRTLVNSQGKIEVVNVPDC